MSIYGNIVIPDKAIKDSLDNIKQESMNLTSNDDLAFLNVQLDFNKLYALMNEAGKHIVDQQLKCTSLRSLKQFAASLPELFSSHEAKVLVESLKGASLSVPDDGANQGDLSYAGMISSANAQEVVPVVMKLIGSQRAQKNKYQKGTVTRMDFPIEIPLISLPEGLSLLTDNGYYIASDDYDVKQIAELKSEKGQEFISVMITQKAIDRVVDTFVEEEKQNAELRKQRRKEMGMDALIDTSPIPILKQNMYIGYARISASAGLSDDGLAFSIAFAD